jgi:uncharacterized NAD(P)/FAD-binding protein YdhS
VAVQLAQRLPAGARILLVEQAAQPGRGLAYSTHSTSHWLNVPAGRLGIDPAHESGFIEWLQATHAGYEAADFVPRWLMGDYLTAQLQMAIKRAKRRELELVARQARVVGWQRRGDVQLLTLADGEQIVAERVVLATGHHEPCPPALPGVAWDAQGMVADPWNAPLLATLPDDAPLLILGSGLTAIDVLTRLNDRGHQGHITLLSRRGLLPQPHRTLEARPPADLSPVAQPGPEKRLRMILRAVRHWVTQARADGRDWRDVMASLRGCTPGLWQRLSQRDRQQFLRHLVPWWDTHRHRLAPGIQRRVEAAHHAGHFDVHAGRITALEPQLDGTIQVHWRARGTSNTRQIQVAAIINCTGASSNLSRTASPLLANLRDQGILTADALDLGLLVDAQLRPLSRNGQPAHRLYYVGPMLKAQWWEATAIPELRGHARDIAREVANACIAMRVPAN